jgi:tight adherence protein B
MVWLAVVCGAVFGLGAFTMARAVRGVDRDSPARDNQDESHTRGQRGRVDRIGLRIGLGLVGGAAAAVVTGWPVGAALAFAGGFWVPSAFGARARRGVLQARLEAIAAWTEQLRDVMAAAAGLEQAIIATAAHAPAPIRDEVAGLAAALEAGTSPRTALRRFANRVDDPAGDLVVAALILATEGSPRRLAELLGRLASSSRDTVKMRLRVETGRARTRSSVKVVTSITVTFSVGIIVFNPTYVDAYQGLVGQIVLVVVAVFFAAAYWWLAHAARDPRHGRFLETTAASVEVPG